MLLRRAFPPRALLLAALASAFLTARPAGAEEAGASERLHALFAEEWAFRLEEFPVFATSVGVHEHDDRLRSATAEAEERRWRYREGVLERLAALEAEGLGPEDRIHARIFRAQLEDAAADFEQLAYLLPINADDGFHIELARLPKTHPFLTAGDYRSYLARLAEVPRFVDEHVGLLRAGFAQGMTQPRVILEGYEVTMATHAVDDPAQSVFYEPFERFPPAVPEAEREGLRAAARAAIAEHVVPAYRRLTEFMVGTYAPGARTSTAAYDLPGGRAYYRQRVRHFTTLDLEPEEIHQIGLREVQRIRAEMEEVIAEVGFEGSFEEFLTYLRTDPRFYAETPEQLLKEASFIAKRMDAKLPALFGRLPRLPYGVAPVPEHLAPKYTAGRYVGPAEGSTEPGYYWVNTHALESRPLYALEALTLHEAVPGHHLQISLANELEDLPPFRRYSYLSAYGEGWGLYSEWLGIEAGFYTDPYSRFGRLTYEMWRACRLVVDTGLHAFGWSRQRAMDFLAERTALSLLEVRTETDRYISWPGQALAYKLGELKIRELRRKAESELGERFDLRAFHDAVLAPGAVPLDVLEEVIGDHIAAQK